MRSITLVWLGEEQQWVLDNFIYTDILTLDEIGFAPHASEINCDKFYYEAYLPVGLFIVACNKIGLDVQIRFLDKE